MSNVTHIEDGKIGRQLRLGILAYLDDPPDSEFQRGYLAALLDLYRDCLEREGDDRVRLAAKLVFPS